MIACVLTVCFDYVASWRKWPINFVFSTLSLSKLTVPKLVLLLREDIVPYELDINLDCALLYSSAKSLHRRIENVRLVNTMSHGWSIKILEQVRKWHQSCWIIQNEEHRDTLVTFCDLRIIRIMLFWFWTAVRSNFVVISRDFATLWGNHG